MSLKYNGGLLLIITAVFVWVTSSEVTQGVYKGYNHPFVVTYVGTSLLIVYLPVAFIKDWLLQLLRHHNNRSISENAGNTTSTCDDKSADSPIPVARTEIHDAPLANRNCVVDLLPTREEGDPLPEPKCDDKLTVKRTAIVGFYIAPLWFLTEYLTNAALSRTSVVSTTLLSSTSGLFTLMIGAVVGEESISLMKVICVIVSMSGVAMTAVGTTWAADQTSTSKNQKHSVIGDVFAVMSAFTSGMFTVLLKKFAVGGERVDMEKLFGFIGLFTIGALWWLVWPFNAMGIEPKIVLPPSPKLQGIIVANSFLGNVLCDFLWGLGVVWTNPLVAALGFSVSIPLAMLEDMVIHGRHYSTLYIIGSTQVFVGFIIVNLADWISQKLRSIGPWQQEK